MPINFHAHACKRHVLRRLTVWFERRTISKPDLQNVPCKPLLRIQPSSAVAAAESFSCACLHHIWVPQLHWFPTITRHQSPLEYK